jgi:hypothetical protein
MQLAVATEDNVAKTLANLRKKLGPTLKGIPLNAVPMDMGTKVLFIKFMQAL